MLKNLFLFNSICVFIKNKLGILIWIYFLVPYSLLLTCISTHWPKPCSLHYCAFKFGFVANKTCQHLFHLFSQYFICFMGALVYSYLGVLWILFHIAGDRLMQYSPNVSLWWHTLTQTELGEYTCGKDKIVPVRSEQYRHERGMFLLVPPTFINPKAKWSIYLLSCNLSMIDIIWYTT